MTPATKPRCLGSCGIQVSRGRGYETQEWHDTGHEASLPRLLQSEQTNQKFNRSDDLWNLCLALNPENDFEPLIGADGKGLQRQYLGSCGIQDGRGRGYETQGWHDTGHEASLPRLPQSEQTNLKIQPE